MNPLQEKLNEIVEVYRGAFYTMDEFENVLEYLVNLTLEEAKRIVAESGEDYHEAYEAIDKMKLTK